MGAKSFLNHISHKDGSRTESKAEEVRNALTTMKKKAKDLIKAADDLKKYIDKKEEAVGIVLDMGNDKMNVTMGQRNKSEDTMQVMIELKRRHVALRNIFEHFLGDYKFISETLTNLEN